MASSSSVSHRRPVITLFTSIRNIGPALRQAQLPLDEIVDEQALGGYGATIEFNPSRLQASSIQKLQAAEILITEPAVLAELILLNNNNNSTSTSSIEHGTSSSSSLLPNLKWCQSTYAGVDPLFRAKQDLTLFPLPFTLTRFAGVFGPPIAEWCLAQIISHERKFDLMRRDQSKKEWVGSQEVLEYRYLSDLTLSILGAGDIGLCIARVAKAFGMKVVGYSTRPKADEPALDESVTDLTTALQAGDYIVSVLPSTTATRNLLSLEAFQVANQSNGGKSPVFVNAGRGDVTDASTIVAALDQNHISAAILDVFEQEPLPPSNPLWTHPKVTVSPHVSGLTRGQDVPNLVVDQYQRYVSGQPLQYVVDWNKCY